MDNTQERTYPLKYGVQIGDFKADLASAPLADAVVYIPIIRSDKDADSGTVSCMQCFSVDGATKEPVDDQEIFMVFLFLAKTLQKGVLAEWQAQLVDHVNDTMSTLSKIVK